MQTSRAPARETYQQLWAELTQEERLPDLKSIENIILASQASSADVATLHSNNRQDCLLHTALLYNVPVQIVMLLVQHFPLMLYTKNNQGHIPLHLGVLIHSTKGLAYTVIWERFHRQCDAPYQDTLSLPVQQLFQNLDQSLLFLGRQCATAPSKFNSDMFPPQMVYDAIAGKCSLQTIADIIKCNPKAPMTYAVTNTGGNQNPYGVLLNWTVAQMPRDSEYDLKVLELVLSVTQPYIVAHGTNLLLTPLQVALRSPDTPEIVKMLVRCNKAVVNTDDNILHHMLSSCTPTLQQAQNMLEAANEKTLRPLLWMILRSLPTHLAKYGTALISRLVQKYPSAVLEPGAGCQTALHYLVRENYCVKGITLVQHTQVLTILRAFIDQCPGALLAVDSLGLGPRCLLKNTNNAQHDRFVGEVYDVLLGYEMSLHCPSQYHACPLSGQVTPITHILPNVRDETYSTLYKRQWGGSDSK